jgi:uncharacterized tellurite resistance protein B-like protein
MAYADNELHPNEKALLLTVGERIGLSDQEINELIAHPILTNDEESIGEIDRYMLFEDLLDVMMADGKITDEEIDLCRSYAAKMGFNTNIVNHMVDKIKYFLAQGCNTINLREMINVDILTIKSGDKYEKHD